MFILGNLDGHEADGSCDEKIFITEDCNQVRRKISGLLADGSMAVKDFIEALNVSSVSYYRFMGQHGKEKGSGSDTYVSAFLFFKNREEQGVPNPRNKSYKEGNRAIARPKIAETSTLASRIRLAGEMEDAVEVYDSCDEIRRKIRAYLKKPGTTQAQFLRDLYDQFHGPRLPKSLQTSQLSKFRRQKGPMTGNTSGIYYAAYVFFEKERIASGRPKTRHRLDMEDTWSMEGGVDMKDNLSSAVYVCPAGSQLCMNSLGRVRSYKIC